MNNLKKAYELGWIQASKWAKRDDLIADIGSPAYVLEAAAALEVQQSQEEYLTITWDEHQTRILAVTMQDEDGRILKVLAEAPAQQPQAEAVPTIYVSKGQLDNLKPDPEDTSGTYLPIRKSPKGKFTHPLFAAPKQAEPFSHATQLQIAYIKGLGDGAQQPQARPDFQDEWTGYLKDGETPFERFLRERKDLNALTKLYQRALEENERLKDQQPQAEAVPLQVFKSDRAKALMRAWQEGWDACRDSEYVGEEAQNDAFNQSATVSHCITEDMLVAPPAGRGGATTKLSSTSS